MTEDKYVDFFLGGNFGNNPVALEVPINGDKSGLTNFLREHGVEAGYDPQQIMVSTDSIITPVIAPENIKPLYRTLELLIQEFNITNPNSHISLGYPHIIDTENIIPSKLPGLSDENWAERIDYVDKMLKEISEQEKHNLIMDDWQVKWAWQFAEEMQKLQNEAKLPRDTLFGGATISDPYSVATGRSHRFLRYATTDPLYAIHYAFGDKGEMNFCQAVSKSGIKYGFVFLYKSQQPGKQMFFDNTGIEYRSEARYSPENETMVNRFNNECIGEYLFLKIPVPGHSGYYRCGYVKIPQNDTKWKKFKEFVKTDNARLSPEKSRRLDAWASGKDKEQVLPLLQQMSVSEFYDSVVNNIENEKQNKINSLDKIKQEIQQLSESTTKLFAEFHTILDGIVEQKSNDGNYNKQIKYYDNAQKSIDNIEQKLEQESQQISDKLQIFQSEIKKINNRTDIKKQMDSADRDITILNNTFIKNKNTIAEKIDSLKKTYLPMWRSNVVSAKRTFVYNFIQGDDIFRFVFPSKQVMHNLDVESKQGILDSISKEFRRDIIPGKRLKYLAIASLFVYYCSTPQQQTELFDSLYKIRKNKNIKDIRKILKESNAELISGGFSALPEITELVKNDNIFIKHTDKGQKIIIDKKKQFEQASQKLQNAISYNIQRKSDLNIVVADRV